MNISDYIPRTIKADPQGIGFIAVHGFGVEILHGGVYGPENTLTMVRGEDGLTDGFVGSDQVPCISGTRILGEFTGLRLVTARVSPVLDTIKVRILTLPDVVAMDSQPTGKPRVRWLARGSSVNLASGAYALMWTSASVGEYDRFTTEEQYDPALVFVGWVGSSLSLGIYGWVNKDTNNPGGNWFQFLTAISVKQTTGTGSPPRTGGELFDFANLNVPYRVPAGSVELYVKNTGLAAATVEWIIGVTGG